jgi:hypothetical protein
LSFRTAPRAFGATLLHVKTPALLLLAFTLGSVLPAGAQPAALPDSPQPPAPPVGRAYFFSEPDFRGEFFVVEAGAAVTNLQYERDGRGQRWNDRVSSVRLEGPVRAVVYADADFRGERLELNRSARDLADRPHGETGLESWNDRISSIKVVARLAGDAAVPGFTSQREADRAIRAAYLFVLGREPDYTGLQTYRRRLLDDGWSEDEMHRQLRRSDEFRQRDVDGIVRRVYREELGREPDPSGAAIYTRALRDRGWTEGQLRAELHASAEGRAFAVRAIVTRAYRDILDREPDAEGMANYSKRMLSQGWNEERVRDALRRSDEFRQRGKPGGR